MPATILSAASRFTSIRISSPTALLLHLALALPIAANAVGMDSVAVFRYTQPVRMELLLPVDGPGSAMLNPARAADARHFHAQYGIREAGDSRATDISLGGGWGGRYFVGASFSGAFGRFDFTNAVVLDNRIGAQAAYRHPLDPEGKGYFVIGVAETFHYVNGMAIFKAARSTPDFGFLFAPTGQPGGWRLELGMAARDLRSLERTVPVYRADGAGPLTESRPEYSHLDFSPWILTGSLVAASPARRWSLFGSAALGDQYDPAYWDEPLKGWDAGPVRGYLPRLGVRYRPVPYASLSMERVWSSFWVLDAGVGTGTWLPLHCDANFRFAYGPNLQYLFPERTGWSLGWNLAIGL